MDVGANVGIPKGEPLADPSSVPVRLSGFAHSDCMLGRPLVQNLVLARIGLCKDYPVSERLLRQNEVRLLVAGREVILI